MSKINYYLALGPLEEVECVIERQTYNYPGCDASVDITSVAIKGVSLDQPTTVALIDALNEDDILVDAIHAKECDYD